MRRFLPAGNNPSVPQSPLYVTASAPNLEQTDREEECYEKAIFGRRPDYSRRDAGIGNAGRCRYGRSRTFRRYCGRCVYQNLIHVDG